MPTSNSYDWTSTRNEIISGAFRKIAALGDFELITDSQNAGKLTAGIAAINPMIKAMHAMGMPVWAITEQYLPFTSWASTPTVSIGPGATINQPIKPLKILQALRRDNSVLLNPIDTPLEILSYQGYQDLADKKTISTPTGLFYQPLAYTGQITLWPLPDSFWQANGQLYIKYQRPFQDFDSATDEPDFPVEWHEALEYRLAVRLAPAYGLSLPDRQILKQEAKEAFDEAKGFDVEEGSFFIRPASRNE